MNTMTRKVKENTFKLFSLITMSFSIVILGVLFFILWKQVTVIDVQFLESYPSRHPEKPGIKQVFGGHFGLLPPFFLSLEFHRLFLEEYKIKGRLEKL